MLIEKVTNQEEPLAQKQAESSFWMNYGQSIGKTLNGMPPKTSWKIRRGIDDVIQLETFMDS